MTEYEEHVQSVIHTIRVGFPFYGLSPWIVIVIGILVIVGFISYSVAGKGRGSHAGREEVRRSYRRKLAQEMAKQDAEEIKAGRKQRRRWMQW